VEAESFSRLLGCLESEDEQLQRAAAAALRDTCRQSREVAQMVACRGVWGPPSSLWPRIAAPAAAKHAGMPKAGLYQPHCNRMLLAFWLKSHSADVLFGVPRTSSSLDNCSGSHCCLCLLSLSSDSGIMALGYMAQASSDTALAIIASEGVPPLLHVLVHSQDDALRAAAAWTMARAASHRYGDTCGPGASLIEPQHGTTLTVQSSWSGECSAVYPLLVEAALVPPQGGTLPVSPGTSGPSLLLLCCTLVVVWLSPCSAGHAKAVADLGTTLEMVAVATMDVAPSGGAHQGGARAGGHRVAQEGRLQAWHAP